MRQLSISSCFSGMEAPEVPVAPSTADGDPSPLELSTPAGSRGPEEDLQLDRASEFSQYPPPFLRDLGRKVLQKRS